MPVVITETFFSVQDPRGLCIRALLMKVLPSTHLLVSMDGNCGSNSHKISPKSCQINIRLYIERETFNVLSQWNLQVVHYGS